MQELFYPDSIAIIGASRNQSKIGSIIFHNILKTNYKGDLFLVNPSARQIEGYPVYKDINQLPQGIKLAIIVIPALRRRQGSRPNASSTICATKLSICDNTALAMTVAKHVPTFSMLQSRENHAAAKSKLRFVVSWTTCSAISMPSMP